MIALLNGNIVELNESSLTIDLGPIGYEVFVSHPEDFVLGEKAKVFVCDILTQDDHYLVGFKTKEEKQAFLDLISVKGIGAKTALAALSKTTPAELREAIIENDLGYLKRLPAIGPKAAGQILLDLRGKVVEAPAKVKKSERYVSIREALRSMGFKVKEIDPVLAGLDDGLSEEEALRFALRGLAKGKVKEHV